MSAPPRPNLAYTLPEILTPGDVLRLFGLHPNTVRAMDRVLKPFRTPCGHRRYDRDVVVGVYVDRLAGRGLL